MKDYQRADSPSITKIEVLRVSFTRGDGSDENPVRYVSQYRDLDGHVLAECDPYLDVNLNTTEQEDTQ